MIAAHGFLNTTAARGADLALVICIVAALLMTLGWRLAVHKRYAAHRWVQTVAVCLVAVPVVALMIKSFVTYILPGIPGKFGEGSYAVTTGHALIGMAAVLLGVWVVLCASELAPRRWRFSEFKCIMRISYLLYMLATVGGVVVYVVVYGGGST